MDYSKFPYNFDPKYVSTILEQSQDIDTPLDLTKRADRHQYFHKRLGSDLERFKEIFAKYTFLAYWLAPKSAGKGTYIGLIKEIVGDDKFAQISVGDLVREFQQRYNAGQQKELEKELAPHYRGFMPLKEAMEATAVPDLQKTMPTEFVLALIKAKIDKLEGKIVFLDGFPRTEDQILYALVMRDLVAYRSDPDFFVLIHIPIQIIDDRFKYRRVCPKCGLSRNIHLLPTEKVEWDTQKNEPILICENPECNNQPLVAKQGDHLGVKGLENRLVKDYNLVQMAQNLHGIPKINLYNAVPADQAKDLVKDYELTPWFEFEYKNGQVIRSTKPYSVFQDNKEYYSLLAGPATVQFIRQILEVFD